jgi:predicted metal-dependent hydrolase
MGLDDIRIEYSDRKTLGLIVERDASILVRAPRGASIEAIERFLDRKRYWLWEKTNHAQKYPAFETLKEFVSGESFLFLGRQYRLEVVDEDFEGLKFDGGFKLSRSQVGVAREVFQAWYLAQAREHIVPRVKRYAERMGVEFGDIRVRDLRYRWGSCTPKNHLVFNWRLVKAPADVIDYIVVHELAHLIEANHTPAFWNIVRVQVPSFDRAKAWLVEHGSEIEAKP